MNSHVISEQSCYISEQSCYISEQSCNKLKFYPDPDVMRLRASTNRIYFRQRLQKNPGLTLDTFQINAFVFLLREERKKGYF